MVVKKKAIVEQEETQTPKPEEVKEEAPVVEQKRNSWSKRIKVTSEQAADLQKEGKMVGYEVVDGQGYALIR